jgi:alpha-amylase
VWLPPSIEGLGGTSDVGYSPKNWFSFQNTKYGSESDLAAAALALQGQGVEVYCDQVHNHLMGGDLELNVWCRSVDPGDKNQPVTPDSTWFQEQIYTSFPWLGLDHDDFDTYFAPGGECYALSAKRFDLTAYQEALMGCDLDYDSMDVVKKLEEAGMWFKQRVHLDGYRFDAVKHIRPKGPLGFLTAMRVSEQRNLFAVGEFALSDVDVLHQYIVDTQGQISLFDFPLQRKLVDASRNGTAFDMGSLHTRTLTAEQPPLSVPFVHSHDDQPAIDDGPSRGDYVGDWFISQAYAMILLRDEGYPMVSDVDTRRHAELIRRYMFARTQCTYGNCYDRFDHWQTIGWSFEGGVGLDNSMAVVMTTGESDSKWLPTGKPFCEYRDLTGALEYITRTNESGWADFPCPAGRTSVWIEATKLQQFAEA